MFDAAEHAASSKIFRIDLYFDFIIACGKKAVSH